MLIWNKDKNWKNKSALAELKRAQVAALARTLLSLERRVPLAGHSKKKKKKKDVSVFFCL